MKTIEELTTGEAAWYASPDEENYYVGPEPTREAVIEAAIEEDLGYFDEDNNCHFVIALCTPGRIRLSNYVDLDPWLSSAEDDANYCGDYVEVFSGVDAYHWGNLEKRIKEVVDAWQVENQFEFHKWAFDRITKAENIESDSEGVVLTQA